MSKQVNSNDILFREAKFLDVKTDDEKAVKNFMISIEKITIEDNFFKNHVNEFKKFTHPSWVTFKELDINKSDCDEIYISICNAYSPNSNQQIY